MDTLSDSEMTAWADKMNRKHGEALIHLARYYGGVRDPLVVEVKGLNSNELFVKVDGHGLSCTLAIPWPEPVHNLDDLDQQVIAMAREARRGIREEGLIPDGDEC